MKQPSRDTDTNYSIIEEAVTDTNMTGAEVLNMFANYYGLQLFDLESTLDLLEEMGFDDILPEED